jgi:hypothetical protein
LNDELECVEGNSPGLILSAIQARYVKVLRKIAINLSNDFAYEAAVLTIWSRNLADVSIFLSRSVYDVLSCDLCIRRAVSGVEFQAFFTSGVPQNEGTEIAQSV